MNDTVREQPIRVLIVDDHQMVREGLKLYLGFFPTLTVVGEAADGCEALERVTELRPQVVLMDLVMPVLDGKAAIRALRERHPEVKSIVLTSSLEQDVVAEALAAGAVACLLKTSKPEELLRAVYDAALEGS